MESVGAAALAAWAVVLILFALDNCRLLLRRAKDVYVYGVSTPDSQARVLIALRQYRDACGTPIRVFFLNPDAWID